MIIAIRDWEKLRLSKWKAKIKRKKFSKIKKKK